MTWTVKAADQEQLDFPFLHDPQGEQTQITEHKPEDLGEAAVAVQSVYNALNSFRGRFLQEALAAVLDAPTMPDAQRIAHRASQVIGEATTRNKSIFQRLIGEIDNVEKDILNNVQTAMSKKFGGGESGGK
jgi:hypothetical protein